MLQTKYEHFFRFSTHSTPHTYYVAETIIRNEELVPLETDEVTLFS